MAAASSFSPSLTRDPDLNAILHLLNEGSCIIIHNHFLDAAIFHKNCPPGLITEKAVHEWVCGHKVIYVDVSSRLFDCLDEDGLWLTTIKSMHYHECTCFLQNGVRHTQLFIPYEFHYTIRGAKK